uniref:Uncharacterized protein n=1 Tax=Romanomermis culicivorax TaxID=13658 RepID=A0A915HJT4_ROMCU
MLQHIAHTLNGDHLPSRFVDQKGAFQIKKVLKDFMGGARAVPPPTNVGIGVTIPTRAQQKWRCSGAMD